MTRLYFFFVPLVFVCSSIFSQHGAVPSVAEDTETLSLPVKKVNQLLDSSIYLRNISLYQSIKLCQQAIELTEKIQSPELLSKSYKTQGINYYLHGINDSALLYYNKAIPQFEALGSKIDVGKIMGNIGLLYKRQAKYDKALEYYLKNLKIFAETNNEKGIGKVFNNLGILYQLNNDLKNAEKHYLLALSNFKKFNITHEIANAYCNLGAIYEKRLDFIKSMDYYNKSLVENEKVGNRVMESRLYFNIGYLYHSQNKLDSALLYVRKSEEIRTQLGDQEGLISSKLELGRILMHQEKYNRAEKLLLDAKRLATDNNLFNWKSETISYLTTLYQKQSNFKKAFESQSQGILLRDSLNSIESAKRFAELVTQYDAERREKELELLQQRTQIQKLELGQKNAWIISLLVVMILGIVAIFVSLRINRLRADHKIMDLRQKVLLTQMNPHFLFNSLTSIQSFILDSRSDDANIYLSKLANLVRRILENSREEFVSLQTELNTLKDYIGLQKLRFENDIAYHFEVDEEIDQNQILVPPMLAQPFVENALIHGRLRNNPNAQINIKVSLSEDKQLLKFQIQDNGIGIEEAKNSNLPKNHKSLATSIALDRVKIYNFKFSKKMNFEIIDRKYLDEKQNGTQVTYSIPIIRS